MNICTYTYEEYLHLVKSFHGSLAPGLIIGGFIVGVMQHGLSAGEAARTYTLLSIGDGLVAQVPSLML